MNFISIFLRLRMHTDYTTGYFKKMLRKKRFRVKWVKPCFPCDVLGKLIMLVYSKFWLDQQFGNPCLPSKVGSLSRFGIYNCITGVSGDFPLPRINMNLKIIGAGNVKLSRSKEKQCMQSTNMRKIGNWAPT